SYRYAAPAHVKFRMVDPGKEPALVDQMKITAARSVNLKYGNESFVVTNPTEETITNGVIRVSGTAKKTVYFAEGNGEGDIQNTQDPRGYSSAKLGLEQENYEVKTLLLPAAEQVPDDASVVVLAGPERPLTDHEVQILDAYLKRGGHLLALVKTSASSWAETNVDEVFAKGTASLDDQDKKGPLSVAVAVTAKLRDLGVEVPPAAEGKSAPEQARLVVFGSAMFADNQELSQSRLNSDLFLNAVGWLVGQEELVSIRSRSIRASRAELTAVQTLQVFYLSVLIVPQLLIATGITVWWRRKSR